MKKMIGSLALGAFLFTLASCTDSKKVAECRPDPGLTLVAAYTSQEGREAELRGTLFNTTMNREYDNTQIKVDFYDNTGQPISTQMFKVEEDVEVGEVEEFSLNFTPPVGADSTAWVISCAEES